MTIKNPPHPGKLVLHDCIEPLGLTITAAAMALRVTRTTLSELVNGNAASLRRWPSVWSKYRRQRRKLAFATSSI